MGRVPGMRTHALGGVRSRNRKQTPLAGDALEDMRPVVEKVKAGTRDEVLYRARHEDLAGRRLRHHARASMDGDAGKLVVNALALSGVKADAGLDTEASHRVADTLGAADGASRAVEAREEAVSGRVDLTPSVELELVANDRMVTTE